MHTKEELTKKRAKSPEQLDLVNEISSADKLKHKRRWLYIALFATTGLSICFWIYRSLKTFTLPDKFPQISFNFPKFSSSVQITLSPQLSAILSQHPEIVGFYIHHDHPSADFTAGSLANLNPDSLKNALSSSPSVSSSLVVSSLPAGINYHENYSGSDGQTIYASLVTNPIDQIFIIIRYHGSADNLKPLLPDLVSSAYWSVSAN